MVVLVLSGAAVAEDPAVLFQRIKAHMLDHLSQLPNYTCHETMDRMARAGNNWQHLDTIELEVAFAGQQELFARPGSERFGEQTIEQLIPGGTFGNRPLGSHIDLIFSRDIAEFKYAGADRKEGRNTVRYDLHVPIEKSLFLVRHGGVDGLAGYEGTVWVDPDTLELVRVDFKVNQIPSYVGVRLIRESLHYKKLRIGKSEFNLPDHSEFHAVDSMNKESWNTIQFDHCHEFAADSVVTYTSPSGTASRERQDH
jgi:hypothetical protein